LKVFSTIHILKKTPETYSLKFLKVIEKDMNFVKEKRSKEEN
jgi:hypothetical protein